MKARSFYILPKNLPEQCPHVQRRGNEDVSYDFCEINDKPCLLEESLPCETYQEFLKELAEEDKE